MHFCMDEVRAMVGLIPMIPEMILYSKLWLFNTYYNVKTFIKKGLKKFGCCKCSGVNHE